MELRSITEYVQRRRETTANYVVDRHVFMACEGGERKRGSPSHMYWLEQPMELDAARDLVVGTVDGDKEG